MPTLKHLVAETSGDPRWRVVRPPLVALPEAAWSAARGLLGDSPAG